MLREPTFLHRLLRDDVRRAKEHRRGRALAHERPPLNESAGEQSARARAVQHTEHPLVCAQDRGHRRHGQRARNAGRLKFLGAGTSWARRGVWSAMLRPGRTFYRAGVHAGWLEGACPAHADLVHYPRPALRAIAQAHTVRADAERSRPSRVNQ